MFRLLVALLPLAAMAQLRVGAAKRTITPDLELWALKKERGYFRAVFGRELEAAVS